MRRRTQKLGGRRTIIYIIVVVLLVAGNYLYDNFAPERAEASEVEAVEMAEETLFISFGLNVDASPIDCGKTVAVPALATP